MAEKMMMLKSLERESCPGEKLDYVSLGQVLRPGGSSEQQAEMCNGVKGNQTEKDV